MSDGPNPLTAGQVIAGLAALTAVAVVGVGIDPAAAGVGAGASLGQGPATASGTVVRVRVQAIGMRFEPAQVHVAKGDAAAGRLGALRPTPESDSLTCQGESVSTL